MPLAEKWDRRGAKQVADCSRAVVRFQGLATRIAFACLFRSREAEGGNVMRARNEEWQKWKRPREGKLFGFGLGTWIALGWGGRRWGG